MWEVIRCDGILCGNMYFGVLTHYTPQVCGGHPVVFSKTFTGRLEGTVDGRARRCKGP